MTEQSPGEQIAETQKEEGAETMLGSDSESNGEQMEVGESITQHGKWVDNDKSHELSATRTAQ